MAARDTIFDVQPGEFDQKVVAASSEAVIVVDFWAPWCGPCRILGPVLERAVESLAGKARLAKVNVDENPEVASRFNVRAIPAVKVFRDGQVVAEFVGALPEADVRRILGQVVPSAADELVETGDALLESGNRDSARQRWQKALGEQPRDPAAALRLARLAFEDGNAEEARRLASLIEEDAGEHEEAEGLLARLDFAERCRTAGGLEASRKRVEETPDDLAARYDLACCLASASDYREAMDELLRIVAADKHFQDELARKAMLRIFSIIGRRSPLADEYRDRLARLLY
jgi:putative thioredoxin